MTGLLHKVDQSIQFRKLFRPGQSFLVAVSGGLDSMVLLHVLHRLSEIHAWKLAVAHFNHRLRGRSSLRDEEFVQAAASRLGLEFCRGETEVRPFARREGISVEMAGRRLRHEFLAQMCAKLGLDTVALAHHADDQVELFFLRLLRGAGAEGLSGMAWAGPSPLDAGIRIVRPVLDCRKQELAAFAKEAGIQFREDASNTKIEIPRNRIRHELIPLLRRSYQPALERCVLRLMDIMEADTEFLAEQAGAWLRRRSRSRLDRAPVALQRQLLRSSLTRLGVVPTFELIEHLRLEEGRWITVRPDLTIRRDALGHIVIRPIAADDLRQESLAIDLSRGKGTAHFAGLQVRWNRQPWAGTQFKPGRRADHLEYFDADQVGSTVVLRHWRPGDRYQPIGLPRSVKLQDVFTNLKIPRALRSQLVVAATNKNEIFWIEGLRIADRFKLTGRTSARLAWRWERSRSTPTSNT